MAPQDGVYDEFAQLLASKVAALQLGQGTAPGVTCGPLITPAARDKVRPCRCLIDARPLLGVFLITTSKKTSDMSAQRPNSRCLTTTLVEVHWSASDVVSALLWMAAMDRRQRYYQDTLVKTH